MIHEIASDIQEALDDAMTARQQNTLPSLDVERASAQETAAQLAKQAAEAEARMKLEAEEEERLERERKARDETLRLEKRKSRKSLNHPPEMQTPAQQTLSFKTARIITEDGVPRPFTEVTVTGSLTNSETKESINLGTPLVALPADVALPVVAVKRRIVKKPQSVAWKLEELTAKLAQLHHPNLLNIFASRVTIVDEFKFELLLCREYADRGESLSALRLCVKC